MIETTVTERGAAMEAPGLAEQTAATAVLHLQPALWAKVNRLLIRKAIAEFWHEKLIEPHRCV